MPAYTKLKSIGQGTFIKGGGPSQNGICYYMCNFIESPKGIWNCPGTFATAQSSAQNFADGLTMSNYAKAQNLAKRPQNKYAAVAGALTTNSIYRIGLWFGTAPVPALATTQNHEIMAITGTGDDVILFDPNFGFYQAAVAGKNNRESLEQAVNELYATLNLTAGNFDYMNVRPITKATPLSFS